MRALQGAFSIERSSFERWEAVGRTPTIFATPVQPPGTASVAAQC
jgi:hypothetical protein